MNLFFLLLWFLIISFVRGQTPDESLQEIFPENKKLPKCEDNIRDVVFLLDTSESITKIDFRLAQQFITHVIKVLKVANYQNRIALVVFGNAADIVFDFKTSDSIDGMIKDVEAIENQNELTAIGKAFNLTLVELFPKMRTDVDKLIILLTDGTNNKYPAPYDYADKLKDAGVKILTIGIGSNINRNELGSLTSPGLSIEFDNFTELTNFHNKIIDFICLMPDLSKRYPCRRPSWNLIILLDSTQSISDEDFAKVRQLLSKMFDKYESGFEKPIVRLISLSSRKRTNEILKYFYEILDFIDSIRNSDRSGDITDIEESLKLIDTSYKTEGRFRIPLTILIITNGVNNIYPKTFEEANFIKADSVNIITLGIGSNVNLNGLKALSSDGKILTADSFNELEKSLKTGFIRIVCDAASHTGSASMGK